MKFDTEHAKRLCEVQEDFAEIADPENNPLQSVLAVMTTQCRGALDRTEELEKALIEERALRMGEYGYLDEIGNRPFPEGEEARKLAREQLQKEGLL